MRNYFLIGILIHYVFLIPVQTGAQPSGESMSFDGNNDYIEVQNNPSNSYYWNVTVEAWIYPCDISNSAIISKNWCSNDELSYYLAIKDGHIQWRGSEFGLCLQGFSARSVEPIIEPFKWSHIAMVHSSDSITFYYNGDYVSSFYNIGAFSQLYPGNESLLIGAYKLISGNIGLLFNGRLDELRIWNKALKQDEISLRIYTSLTGNEDELILYYDMEDIVGVGQNVTINNKAYGTGLINNGITHGTSNSPFTLSNEIGLDNLDLGNDFNLCPSDTVILSAEESGKEYMWQDGTTDPIYVVTEPGIYWVAASIGSCMLTDTIYVGINQEPELFQEEEITLNKGEEVTIEAPPGYLNYLWQDGSTGMELLVSDPGVYWLQVYDGQCTWTDSISVIYNDCMSNIFVPNCFTPNGDMLNDEFHLVTSNIELNSLFIFNRWGELLFETDDVTTGWDGKYNGKECPFGTYFYKVDYTESCGDREVKKLKLGAVMLLR